MLRAGLCRPLSSQSTRPLQTAPVVSQDDIYPGAGSQAGLGDVAQCVFFSPRQPTESGWIWGIGPVIMLPTATDDLPGTGKWGPGPTVVGLKQNVPWTVRIK